MINIVFKRDKNHSIKCIEVKGHARSGEAGFDLVCAGVSAIIIGGANALQGDTDKNYFKIILKSGYALIKHNDNELYDEKFLYTLETMFKMLKTMEESNPKYIKILEKDI